MTTPNGPTPFFDAVPSSQKPVKIWGLTPYYLTNVAVVVVIMGIAVYAVVAHESASTGSFPRILGVAALIAGGLVLFLFVNILLRPISITTDSIRIPKGFRMNVIPLKDVAGIGLVYQFTPGTRTPAGWELRVWNGNKPVRVLRWIVVSWGSLSRRGSRRQSSSHRNWSTPLAHENAEYLPNSRPGRIAREMYAAAIRAQGPNGLLERNELEKSIALDPNQPNQTVAWWAPDGTMGRAKGAPTQAQAIASGTTPPPASRYRQLKSLLVLVVGFLVSVIAASLVAEIDSASTASHHTGAQDGILIIAVVVFFVLFVVSILFTIRAWRRPRNVQMTAAAAAPVSPISTSWSFGSQDDKTAVVIADRADPPAVVRPVIRRSRKRVMIFNLVNVAVIAIGGAVWGLTLGSTGHIANGEVCSAVVGPTPLHQSIGCAAWRHHELVLGLSVLIPLAIILVASYYFMIRQTKLQQNVLNDNLPTLK